jgi:hypothetical protein
MANRVVKFLFRAAQRHFELMHECDVCLHTGVLIPRRPRPQGKCSEPPCLGQPPDEVLQTFILARVSKGHGRNQVIYNLAHREA